MTLAKANQRLVMALAFLAGSASSGMTAECRFDKAIYTQKESSYVLRFKPSRELGRFPGTSNFFYVEATDLKKPLTAWVIWNNGESRPTGSVMLDCPEDGMSNEDYEACTHWKGVMYSLTGDGAELLPMESEPAPATILLPDFGRKMRYSLLSGVAGEEVPWDVFRFDRCDG